MKRPVAFYMLLIMASIFLFFFLKFYANTSKLPVNVFFPFYLPIQISGNNRKSFFSLFNIFFYSIEHF